MSYDTRAHIVCEEFLSILRRSKLNYLVKETPYSAFVTIRKRLVKNGQELSNVTLVQGDSAVSDGSFKAENYILKQRCKDLEVKNGFLEVDIENLEVKVETLNKENINLCAENETSEQKIGVLNAQIDCFESEVNQKNEELLENELKREFLQAQMNKLKSKVEQSEKSSKAKDDNIELLESIIRNKDSEIAKIKSEMDSTISQKPDNLESNSEKNNLSCDQCDFTTENAKGLKIHMGKMHEVKCETCNDKFAGESKLKTHMCRLHVDNPSSTKFYMKNWYIKNSCISIFSEAQKKEVAVLHSEHCTKSELCSECPPNLESYVRVDDKNDMIHLQTCNYLESGKISWDVLEANIEGYLCDTDWFKNNSKANA